MFRARFVPFAPDSLRPCYAVYTVYSFFSVNVGTRSFQQFSLSEGQTTRRQVCQRPPDGPKLMSSTDDRRIWRGFCFEIVTLDLDGGEINHLGFIIYLVMFLDKGILRISYNFCNILFLICFNI